MFDSSKEAELKWQRIIKTTVNAATERSAVKYKLVLEEHFEYKKTKTETVVQQNLQEIKAECEAAETIQHSEIKKRNTAVTATWTLQLAKKKKKVSTKIYVQERRISRAVDEQTLTDVDTWYWLSLLHAREDTPPLAGIPP